VITLNSDLLLNRTMTSRDYKLKMKDGEQEIEISCNSIESEDLEKLAITFGKMIGLFGASSSLVDSDTGKFIDDS